MSFKRFLFLLFILAFAHTAFAQITAATVSGTIKDQTGAVLPGVDVVVKNADTGLTRSSVTDANGYFTMPGLPPGTYEVGARSPWPHCSARAPTVFSLSGLTRPGTRVR